MDAPKCIDCLKDGRVGQTYKVAGKQLYKCSDCKDTYNASDFQPIEFTWRTDPQSYAEWLRSKGIEIGAKVL